MKLFSVKCTHGRSKKDCTNATESSIKMLEQKNTELTEKIISKLDENIAYTKLLLLSINPNQSISDISKKVWSMYPTATGFLEDVQKCNLLLMKEFKLFCDKLGVKFWLHAGTLIGALRNNGFIQWDDDVDVAMTRADFNIIKSSIEDNNTLQLCEYYNEITCSRQYQIKYKNKEIPVFIDVVIYDICNATTPAEENHFWENYRKLRGELLAKFYNELHSPKITDIGYSGVGIYEGDIKNKVDKLIEYYVKKNNFLY